MRELTGKRGLVTGACSGIGLALAEALAKAGVDLLLASNNPLRLEQVAQKIRNSSPVQIETFPVDVADSKQLRALADVCIRERINLLVNNAGLLYHGPLHDMELAQADTLLAVNLQAPIQLTQMLLPALLEQRDAHIVNVASMCGFVAFPKLAVYQATKYGLLGFSESLRTDYGKLGIGVTTLCPGFVKTRLFTNAKSAPDREPRVPPNWLCTTPEYVAKKTLRAIRRNRRMVVVTPLAHSLYWLRRVSPGLLDCVTQLGKRRATRKRLARLAEASANLSRTGEDSPLRPTG
jgi:short-subunit dehydrogenase